MARIDNKYLNSEEWVQLKEDISALIFDHGYESDSDLIDHVRPHEETCNELAESIMEFLGFELIKEKDNA